MLRHHLGWYSPILERFCFIVTTLLIMQPVAFFYLSIYPSIRLSIYLWFVSIYINRRIPFKYQPRVQMHPALAHYRIIAATLGHRRPLNTSGPRRQLQPLAAQGAVGDSCGRQLPATAAGDSCRQLACCCRRHQWPTATTKLPAPRSPWSQQLLLPAQQSPPWVGALPAAQY